MSHTQSSHSLPDKVIISKALLLSALPILFAIWATATWDAGFYHDDAVTSTWDARAKLEGRNTWEFATSQYNSMIIHQGRFAPAYNFGITPILVSIGDNLVIYRLWHFAWLAGALTSMAWLVGGITGRLTAGALAFATMLALMHVTTYHDSLLSYGVVLPQVVVFGFLGLQAIWQATARDSKYSWVFTTVAVLCVAIAILTSEFGLVFLPLTAFVLMFRLPLRQATQRLVPFVVLGIAYVAVTLSIKAPQQYEGTSFGSMNISVILRTWYFQLSGTLPFGFALSEMGLAPFGLRWWEAIFASPVFWVTLACAWPAFYFVSCRGDAQKVSAWRTLGLLVLIGLTLLLIPAFLTSFSAKYQKELMFGVAYMQSLLQFCGIAVVLSAGWLAVCRLSLHRPALLAAGRLVLASILAGLFASNHTLNRAVVSYLNDIWLFPRQNLADTLPILGLPDNQPSHIVVGRNWLHRWEDTPFAFRHAGTHAKFVTLREHDEKPNASAAWFVSYQLRGAQYGFVFFAQILHHSSPASTANRITFVPGSQRMVIFSPDEETGITIANASCAFQLDPANEVVSQKRLGHRRFATTVRCDLPYFPVGQ